VNNIARHSAAALIVSVLCASLQAQEIQGTLVVANRAGGSVSFIDLPTGVELARHPIGPRVPHELAISPNRRLVLTSNYGTGEHPGSSVLVFDVPAAALIGTIDLGPETRPHSLAFLPDGRRAVASMERAGAIALIDVFDRRIVDTFAVGGEDNHMVRVSPDGRTAYVAGRGGNGTLSIVDLTGERETVVLETGAGAEGLAVTHDGREVWVANRLANSVSVVDAQRRTVTRTIRELGFVGRVAASAAGRVVVASGGGQAAPAPQRLLVFAAGSERLIAEHVARDAGSPPGPFSLHIDGELLFVADGATGNLVVYDLDEFPSSRVIAEGQDRPDGLVYSHLRMNVLTR
jgi:YVTN family beta-propeller protein